MLRIRTQVFAKGQKKATVEIISVDQFTRRCRLIDKYATEREHLKALLDRPVGGDLAYSLLELNGAGITEHIFWLERN